MDFPEGETDKFYVGSDDFGVYQCNFHQNQDNQNVSQQYFGHSAPVTKVHCHPRGSQSDISARSEHFNDLVLSSSMDWTIKLWSPKKSDEPLFTFENAQEYVFDVEWNTVHPSMFACCDGDGFIEVWDLNKDTEAPIAHKQSPKRCALNALKWNSDGRRLAVGDSDGFVSIWSLDKEYSQAKTEDFTRFDDLIENQMASLNTTRA
jgi:dynein intermediate chain